jgi:peptidoglycan/xylan/chitin deacetylase (PgdA/CDA1 family)
VSDIVVLCYHATTPAWPSELSVPPESLARQVRMLLERRYKPVRFADLLDPGAPRRRVAVTFDDAYRSTYELAWPALRELGVPATVYAPTNFVGADGPMSWPGIADDAAGPHADELRCMTWDQLGELQQAGWEIGSHTCSHPHLSQCDDDSLERELVVSRETIAQRLGSCTTIASPYGDVDGRVMSAARRAGYQLAAALPAHVRRPVPLAWPRLGIYPQDDDWRFRLKVSRVVRALRATAPGHRLVESEPAS